MPAARVAAWRRSSASFLLTRWKSTARVHYPARSWNTKYLVLGWCVIVAAMLVPARSAAADDCTPRPATGEIGVLLGSVRDGANSPVDGAFVVARWRAWDYSGEKLVEHVREAFASADEAGHYRLCAVPTLVQVVVQASEGSRLSPQIVLTLRDSEAVPLDLVLHPGGSPVTTIVRSAPRGPISVFGIVTEGGGAPVAGARISIDGLDGTVLSAEDGRFEISGLASGEHVVSVRQIGFEPQAREVRVATGEPARVSFVLAQVPVELAEVVTLAARSSFEITSGFGERRRRGPGAFFDRVDLERRKPHKLTDVLHSVPGFRVETTLTRWGYQTTPRMERASSGSVGCQLDYYVNGHEYTPTSMGIDNDVPAGQVEAIEVYKPSETPAQFHGKRSRCGVVVIWTRYRAHEVDR